MLQYADRKHVVTAIQFDGTDASALAILKEFGSDVAMSAKGGAIVLTLSRRRDVAVGSFVFKRGDLVTALTEEKFAERFIQIGPTVSPAIASSFPPAPASPVLANRIGEFAEGMHVTENGGDGEVMEILEIEGEILICDSAWGEKKLHHSRARVAAAPVAGDGE